MANIKKTVAEICRELKRRLCFLTPDAFNIASRLMDHILKKTKTTSHINFIGRCLKKKVIPVGFRIKFHASTANDQRVASITKTCSRQLMQTTLHSLKVRQVNFSSSITRYTLELRTTCSSADYHNTRLVIHELNSRLYLQMKSVKENKLLSLCDKQLPRQMNNNTVPLDDKLVVTIPTDLELSEAEKSVLGEGLTFVPVERNINEYKTKADCEKFYRLLRLKAHFHGRDTVDTVATPEDCFAKFNRKVSTWNPPEGNFSAVDHYIDRCRQSVDALKFEARMSYSNLPQVEKEALKNLLKRDEMILSSNLPTKEEQSLSGDAICTFKRHYNNYRTVVSMSDSTMILLRNTRAKLKLQWTI